MANSSEPDSSLVIKNGFLEFVGDPANPTSPVIIPKRQRSQTDPDIYQNVCYGDVREHFHGSDSASTAASDQPDAVQVMPTSPPPGQFDMNMLATPESTPLQCPVRDNLAMWTEGEWDMSLLPEAYSGQMQDMSSYYYWPDQCGMDEAWQGMSFDGSLAMPNMCDQHLSTICEQYDMNGIPMMEHAYMPVEMGDVTQTTAPSEASAPVGEQKETRSSVMLRDIPETFTRTSLLKLLDAHGFYGRFNFLYLPIDFKQQKNLGYALINLVSASEALRFTKFFDGFSKWDTPSDRVCSVAWCSPQQGLEAHVERYRNSSVMHESVPEEWRPLLLSHGVPLPFPPPTTKIKAPKVKGMHS